MTGVQTCALPICVAVGGQDFVAPGVVLGEELACGIVGAGLLCSVGAFRTGKVSSGVITVLCQVSRRVGDGLQPAVFVVGAAHDLSAGVGQVDQVADLVVAVLDSVASGVGVFGDAVQGVVFSGDSTLPLIMNILSRQ